jgi:xanthine dehydrogenase YagT iron-sulfur-binding subunit
MLDEAAAGHPSAVSGDVAAPPRLDRPEIAERMSGNLCRCAAYVNIVTAIERVHAEDGA